MKADLSPVARKATRGNRQGVETALQATPGTPRNRSELSTAAADAAGLDGDDRVWLPNFPAPAVQGGKTIQQNSDINVTPFVDIMLVLLIIFMVSAPLATVSIKLDLPPATPPTNAEKQKEPTYISIQESGSIFIADKQTTIETLANDVCAAVGNPTGQGCRKSASSSAPSRK
jgi:biopolymer transport protein ExbD